VIISLLLFGPDQDLVPIQLQSLRASDDFLRSKNDRKYSIAPGVFSPFHLKQIWNISSSILDVLSLELEQMIEIYA
jgi:hypothetical protein